jgi:hypothetical protein
MKVPFNGIAWDNREDQDAGAPGNASLIHGWSGIAVL